jgi:hypothetical protein
MRTPTRANEVSLSSESKLDEFEYGSLSDWIEVEAGTVCLTVTDDRAGINDAIFDAAYPVAAGNTYLVVITDALAPASAVDRSPILDAAAGIQVVNAAVDVPAINVIVPGEDITLASQRRYSQNVEYERVSAGSFDVEVCVAETAFTQPGATVEADKVDCMIVIGSPNDDDHLLFFVPVDDETVEREARRLPA